ncbi:MAG: hypothetical protein IPL53_21670 [Ignavibacteria bacterium]|nr:hypothetical protein [Ignavibacteria bacterium]
MKCGKFTDEAGNYFDKFYDAVGNLRREIKYAAIYSQIENPPIASLITDYKYDSLYRVIQVRTPNNLDIIYTYDGFGRQSKRDTPDAGLTDFYYDKNNNLIYSQDRKQKTTNSNKFAYRSYDGLNRLTGIGETIMQSTDPNDGIQFQPSTQGEYLTVNVYDTISSAIINSFFTGVSGYSVQLNYTKGNLAATAYRTVKTDTWNFKYYRYDVRGRVIKMWNIIAGFDTLITEYTYNSQDQIITYKHSKDGDEKTFAYTYDYSGRLQKVFQDLEVPPNAPQQTIFSEYEYNENSQVTQQIFHNGLMSNDLSYTNRNWISTVTNSSDILNYTNLYFKNGNVKSQSLTGDYNKSFDNNDDLTFHLLMINQTDY